LAEFGLEGTRNPGWTGVWIQPAPERPLQKIASIGVAVKKWVTYHGIALNVSTNLAHFRQINPCGLESQVMTSMAQCLDRPVDLVDVHTALVWHFHRIFYSHPVD
jgi:lipoate-protein ligase B